MADFTFLFNRKGALYPLDLSSAASFDSPRAPKKPHEWPFSSARDSSLVHLCCKVVVTSPREHLDYATDVLPAELFIPLFRASLYPVKDHAIDTLINKWPYKSLVVSKFISDMFSSLVISYSDAEMGQRTRLGVKYSADIVHSFIDALRNRRTKLRYLDMSGLPIAEIIVKYVATHCRLAQKEFQRNCLIDEYLQNVNDLESLCEKSHELSIESASSSRSGPPPPLIRNDLRKTTSLPEEQLVFRFDCILQERATFDELMGALDANSLNTRFKLQIAKLDLLCLGKANIIKLLDKLDKEVCGD